MSLKSSQDNRNISELNNTILSFSEISGEIKYRKAKKYLSSLVDSLDLTEEEKIKFQTQIKAIEQILTNLEGRGIEIAAFGMVGRGKSSLLNALVGEEVFVTGALHGVTQTTNIAVWDISEEINKRGDRGVIKDYKVKLLDTPGIDEVNGESRETLAYDLAEQIDLVLFVVSGDISQVEFIALSKLKELGKRILLVFNKVDLYSQKDRLEISKKIVEDRLLNLLAPEDIIMVSASPMEVKAIEDIDGKLKVKRVRSQPQVVPLRNKILNILDRESDSLIAVNSMQNANKIYRQLVREKLEHREPKADLLIERVSKIKALAIAFIPVTALDLFVSAVLDLILIISLSNIYSIPLSNRGAISLMSPIILGMLGIFFSELLGSSLNGFLEFIFFSSNLSIAIFQGAIGLFSAYSIGKFTKTVLANDV